MSASHHDELHQEDYMSDKLWEGIGGRGGEMMITAIEPSLTESANSCQPPFPCPFVVMLNLCCLSRKTDFKF